MPLSCHTSVSLPGKMRLSHQRPQVLRVFIPALDFSESRVHEIQHTPRDLPKYLKHNSRAGHTVWLLLKENDFIYCSVQI